MFNKILIANRGEIACRIIRTARRLGIRTVAVYSEADAQALHVAAADEALLIGPAPARESYLSIARILDAARKSGAQAIHPGYGFLSENADFAQACAEAGITFIGPSAAAIRALGDKAEAKTLMERAGIPTVPGYHGKAQDTARFAEEALALTYPVLVKAAAGGGGRGMRVVAEPSALAAALELGPQRGSLRLRQRAAHSGEIPGATASCGGAGLWRPARTHGSSVRARLLGAAPPPEGARGIACARTR